MSDQHVYRDFRYEFGKQVLTLRTRAALTQSALAAQAGVHWRSVQNWEAGVSYPKADALQRLIASFLASRAFTPGAEREEAERLWKQAAQDGGRTLTAFDEAWFAHLLAVHAAAQTQAPAPGQPSPTPPDVALARASWHEGIVVPTLYGREADLETLRRWIVGDRCRVVTVVGLGGIGKSSLAVTAARRALPQFEAIVFRSLQNAPPLAEVLDHAIRTCSIQQEAPPPATVDKLARLAQLLRERRCLLILDNFEAVLQPGMLTGSYRAGYGDYGELIQRLGEDAHQSCLVLTSREKPIELGVFEGLTAPVRTLELAGLPDDACQRILASKDIVASVAEVQTLARLYGGNPLALQLAAEPIRELFGGDVGAFLAVGDAFLNGVEQLLRQQFARSTPLEQAILYWLAVEREPAPFSALLAHLGKATLQRELLAALESLRRRMLIERAPGRPAFSLQPVILEYVTDQLAGAVGQEVMAGQPGLLASHALIQATARDYIRRTQEQLIAAPLLERLSAAAGGAGPAEQRLLALLAAWRDREPAEQGYGPGNVINLLRLLRGQLRGLDLTRLTVRQAYLQGVDLRDASLGGAALQDCLLTDSFDVISAIATSSDGSYWAAASRSGELRLWRAGSHVTERVWQAHTASLRTCDLVFSPDGRTLASGSWDGTVKLWHVATGRLLWSAGHGSHVQRVVFAPHGRLLASGGGGTTVAIWDVESGEQLQALPHPYAATNLAWSPDGDLLATSDRSGEIRLWAVAATTPAPPRTLAGHATAASELVFAPHGQTLVSGGWDGVVRLWDLDAMGLRQTLIGYPTRVRRLAFSPDGRTLAVAGSDPAIWLWDVESDRYRAALHGHSAGVEGVAFTPDGRSLLSGGEDKTVRVWDVAGEQCVRTIAGYSAALYAVDWSPEGTHLVSGGADGQLTCWDLSGATPPRVLHAQGWSVFAARWSPDGRWLASSIWDATVTLLDPASGAPLQTLQHPRHASTILYGVAWSPDGRRLACGTHRRGVQVFEMAGRQQSWGHELRTWIRPVAWSPDGGRLAGGGDDGAVYVWDAIRGALLLRLTGHQPMVTSVAWGPDGSTLASAGGAGGELFIWDVERGQRLRSLEGHAGAVCELTWGADGELLISAAHDGTLRWWEVRSGRCVRARQAHQGSVQSLRRSPDGTRLATCGDDGAVTVWELQSGASIQTLRRDRPYERLDITAIQGLTEAQLAMVRALGAVERAGPERALAGGGSAAGDGAHPQARALSQPHPAASLPFQPTSFIGRSAELARIARLIGEPACRLLTLLGPGGMGKTRLAIELASRQLAQFADGAAFVALASISRPTQIASAIGEALGLAFAGQADLATQLISSLRDRRLLLVLDNFEHLLGGAELVSAILAGAPGVTILVTSRVRLDLQAEWLYDVEGLSYPAPNQPSASTPRSLSDLAGYSAVQLFAQRASQVQPRLVFSGAALEAVVRICERLAGMPLAIELAAASARTLSFDAIEQRIHLHLDALDTSLRDVAARHRSLRAVFEHSRALLSEAEDALVSRLAVFRGGCTAAAAEQLTGATLPALEALVDKSLLRRASSRGDRAAQGHVAEPRFMQLEPIREFALERLEAMGELQALQRAHASYYLTLADGAMARWEGPDAHGAIAQLERELNNIRAALQWARDSGQSTLGLQLAGVLWRFWRSAGYTTEGRAWLEELLAVESPAADAAAISARLLGMHAAAWLASDQHDYARATQLFQETAALRRGLGEAEGETNLLLNQALHERAVGQYRQATAILEETLARHRAMSAGGLGRSLYELGFSLYMLALVLREQGDFSRANALFEESVMYHREIGDRESMAQGIMGLSDVARDQGEAGLARGYAEQSLAIYREFGTQWAIGFLLNNLAQAAYLEGELAPAGQLIGESIALFRHLQAETSLGEVYVTQGHILRAQGDLLGAHEAMVEALRLATLHGPRLLVASALEGLASVTAQSRQPALAARLIASAATLRTAMGAPIRPADRPVVDRTVALVRSALGGDAFAAICSEAQALSLEQILAVVPRAVALTGPTG